MKYLKEYKIFENDKLVYPEHFEFIDINQWPNKYQYADVPFNKDEINLIEDKTNNFLDRKQARKVNPETFEVSLADNNVLFFSRYDLPNTEVSLYIHKKDDEYYYIIIRFYIRNILLNKFDKSVNRINSSIANFHIKCDGINGVLMALDKIKEYYDGIEISANNDLILPWINQ